MAVRRKLQGWRKGKALAAAILVSPFLGGCAGTIDTLTSQRFREHPFRTMFSSDDPMWVLENVPEGDARARAMTSLKEPKPHGGKDDEQKRVMQIISASATSDKQVVCRLSAIETLARFEDPQASQILVMAYQNAAAESGKDEPSTGVVQAGRKVRRPFAPVSSFTPDQVAMIQCRALEALGKKRSPEGLALLCDVAAKPPAPPPDIKQAEFDPLGEGNLGQDPTDLRLAAIRALGHYKNDMQAALLLYHLVQTERSHIAVRGRAYESLKAVTGKDHAPDSPDWKLVLQVPDKPRHEPPGSPNFNEGPPIPTPQNAGSGIPPQAGNRAAGPQR